MIKKKEYRIVEEIGSITGYKKFYAQVKVKKRFSKRAEWKDVTISVYGTSITKTFMTLDDAKLWLNKKKETIIYMYHY